MYLLLKDQSVRMIVSMCSSHIPCVVLLMRVHFHVTCILTDSFSDISAVLGNDDGLVMMIMRRRRWL